LELDGLDIHSGQHGVGSSNASLDLRNTKIRISGLVETSYANGVWLSNSSPVDISNVQIADPYWNGISAYGGSDLSIANTQITDPMRHGLYLSGTQSVGIASTLIHAPASDGISAGYVQGLTLSNSVVEDAGAGTNVAYGLRLYNPSGEVRVEGSTITGSSQMNIAVSLFEGTLDFFLLNTEVSHANDIDPSSLGGVGLDLSAGGDAVGRVLVGDGTVFKGNASFGILAGPRGGATEHLTVDGSSTPVVFVDNGLDVSLQPGGTTVEPQGFYLFEGVRFENTQRGIQVLNNRLSMVHLTLSNTTFQGSAEASEYGNYGVGFHHTEEANGRLHINNTIMQMPRTDQEGLDVTLWGSGRLDATVAGNQVTLPPESTERGLSFAANNSSTLLCGNVLNNAIPNGAPPIRVYRSTSVRFLLEDHGGLGATPTDAEVASYLSAQNGGTEVQASTGNQFEGVAPGSCLLPVLPTLPSSGQGTSRPAGGRR
jgi:hypothetical protein